ncbi:MAG: tetratricopeptide repeat protein [Bacteroidia bacterium]|nr:tetratricopeptide repeat protein [Bacteroidia bacterium]
MNANDRFEEIRRMLAEEPDDLFLHYAMALEYVRLGEPQQGIAILTAIREKDPEYLPVYMKLGTLYQALQRYPDAVEVLEAGIREARVQQQFKTLTELEQVLEMVREDMED